MSTLAINLAPPKPESGPACEKCAGLTRLVGIEPHPRLPHTDDDKIAALAGLEGSDLFVHA